MYILVPLSNAESFSQTISIAQACPIGKSLVFSKVGTFMHDAPDWSVGFGLNVQQTSIVRKTRTPPYVPRMLPQSVSYSPKTFP